MSNQRIILLSLLAIFVFAGGYWLIDANVVSDVAWMRNSIVKNADRASKIVVKRDGEVELTKSTTWRISRPFKGSADQETVNRLLDLIAFNRVKDVVLNSELSRLGRDLKDFGLTDPKVTLSLLVNNEEYVVGFGDFTPAKDGVYATISGVDGVAIIASNIFTSVDIELNNFRERTLLPVVTAEISSMDIKRGPSLITRINKESEIWKMQSPRKAKVSDARVKSLIDVLTAARAHDFAWPSSSSTNVANYASASLLAGYGLDSESAVTVSLRNRFGVDEAITFGNDDGNGNVYALAQSSSVIVTVDASLKQRVLDDVDSFLDSRLFPYSKDSITSLRIVDTDETYIVAKDSKGFWRMDAPFSADADEAFVMAIIDRLINLRSVDVDPAGVAVTVGKDTVATTVSPIALLGDKRLVELRSCEILKFDPASIKRLVAGVGATKQSLAYDLDRKQWNIENQSAKDIYTIDMEAVGKILNILASFKALRVESFKTTETALGSYGLERPQYILAVDRNKTDSIRRNILIGDKTDDGYYVTVGASDAVFVVDATVVEDLMKPLYR